VARRAKTTGEVYAGLEAVTSSADRWLLAAEPHVAGCEPEAVRKRLAQRIVEAIEGDLSAQLKTGHLGASCRAGGLRIDVKSGQVRVTAKLFVRCLGQFAAVWGREALSLATGILAPRRHTGPATLLTETGGVLHDSDERLAEFCRLGPIAPLREARLIIALAARPPSRSTDPRLTYARRAVPAFASLLRPSQRLRLLAAHVGAPIILLRALVRRPVCVLLARDIAHIPVWRGLDRARAVEAIVATTSSFTVQPLWAKGRTGQTFKYHMLWYSQNFIPKMYRGDRQRPDLPAARHVRADVHWVWTEGFAAYLRDLGSTAEMRVVGPILWYIPAAVPWITQDAINVAIFDITPLPDGGAPFGAAQNYYTVDRMSQFVRDALAACVQIARGSSRPCRAWLKHKRPPRPGFHDAAYLRFLENLTGQHPWFRLVPEDTNVFGLLSACDLSISVPYTSTAYVGATVGKPAVFYDPDGTLLPRFEPHPKVRFAAGPDELTRIVLESLTT
jgi:hypothetical protein